MPDVSLSEVADAALSAFLHRELFDVGRVLPNGFGGYGVLAGHALIDLDDLCTPSGEARILDAMGERGWRCNREYHGPVYPDPHVTMFWESAVPQNAGKSWGESSHKATLLAATLALLPSASDEARRILRADTRATTDG